MTNKEKLQTQAEMDRFLTEIKKVGVKDSPDKDTIGLGDAVESVLTRLGITQERYKAWRGLNECSCTERKHYLNKIFPSVDPFGWLSKK